MNYYALFHHFVDDYIMRRAQFRDDHLELATETRKSGELILAGAFSDPAEGSFLVFKTPDKSVMEEFVKNDPYVKSSLPPSWEIRQCTVVIGNN